MTKVEKSISKKFTRDKSREEGKKGQGGQALGGLARGGTEDREGPVCQRTAKRESWAASQLSWRRIT